MEKSGIYATWSSPDSPLGGARPPCPICFSGDRRRYQKISEILALESSLEITGYRRRSKEIEGVRRSTCKGVSTPGEGGVYLGLSRLLSQAPDRPPKHPGAGGGTVYANQWGYCCGRSLPGNGSAIRPRIPMHHN
eukprot:6136227-Prymnesium_polylepis.3